MNELFHKYCLLFCLFLFCTSSAWAQLDGSVEWGYASFEQSSDGLRGDLTASHFTQKYSLMYSQADYLADGRIGYYDVGLGAEWGAFNGEISGESVSNDALKFLYKGRIQLAPGGLPFRLDAYSYDTTSIGMPMDYAFSGTVVPSGIVTDLYNGQTIVSGVQFIAGIRNGSYLGKYRELLSQWPRLLVDYRDVYRVDKKSSRHPEEYRDRDLAFVSLNKKDNWFHYRIYEHEDYLQPENNTHKSVIMLGTVDHTLKRQWIHLTNWIRISVDGAYTVLNDSQDNSEEKTYNLNLFSTMQRRNHSGSTFVTLQRHLRNNRLTQRLNVPLYLTNRLSPDATVRSTFSLTSGKKSVYDGYLEVFDQNSKVYYGKVLLEANQRGHVQVRPSLEAAMSNTDTSDGTAIRGVIEVQNNLLRRSKLNWFGKGSLATFEGKEEFAKDSDFWEAELQGSFDYNRLHDKVRFGGDQILIYGKGFYRAQGVPLTPKLAALVDDPVNETDDDVMRSITTLYLEHHSFGRALKNRLEFVYTYGDQDEGRRYRAELVHNLTYQQRWWSAVLTNQYLNTNRGGWSESNPDLALQSGQFMQRLRTRFSPNKHWLGRFDYTFIWGDGDSGVATQSLYVEQSLERTFFTKSSLRRRLGDVTERVTYDQAKGGIERMTTTFSLVGNYFPTRHWRMGASVYYTHRDKYADSYSFGLSTGLDFPLFKVNFSYAYGAVDNENNTVAHRYEVNVKKIF